MNLRKVILALSLAALMILGVVGTASATRLLANEDDFAFRWSELTFSADAGGSVRCGVTFSGSFHSRTITKTERSLIGHITSVSVASCSGGTVTALSGTLPWHLRYRSFSGSLPNITSATVDVVDGSLSIQPTGSSACLARSTSSEPLRLALSNTAGLVRTVRADETAGIDLTGGFICEIAGDGQASGTGAVTRAEGGELHITLLGVPAGRLTIIPINIVVAIEGDETTAQMVNSSEREGSDLVPISTIVVDDPESEVPSGAVGVGEDNEEDAERDRCADKALRPEGGREEGRGPEETRCEIRLVYIGDQDYRPIDALLVVKFLNGSGALQTAREDVTFQ